MSSWVHLGSIVCKSDQIDYIDRDERDVVTLIHMKNGKIRKTDMSLSGAQRVLAEAEHLDFIKMTIKKVSDSAESPKTHSPPPPVKPKIQPEAKQAPDVEIADCDDDSDPDSTEARPVPETER